MGGSKSLSVSVTERQTMKVIQRCGFAAGSVAALASLTMIVAPVAVAASWENSASAVHTRKEMRSADCTALTTHLAEQLKAGATALSATMPDVVAARKSVMAAQKTFLEIQARGCVSGAHTGGPGCDALKLQLRQNLQAFITAVVAYPPVKANVDMALNNVLKAVADLSVNSCMGSGVEHTM